MTPDAIPAGSAALRRQHLCGRNMAVSTAALQILEMVRRLPAGEQRAVRDALARHAINPAPPTRRQLQRLPDGSYYNPDGIPNDDPIFKILENIEEERHRTPGPPAPDFA